MIQAGKCEPVLAIQNRVAVHREAFSMILNLRLKDLKQEHGSSNHGVKSIFFQCKIERRYRNKIPHKTLSKTKLILCLNRLLLKEQG